MIFKKKVIIIFLSLSHVPKQTDSLMVLYMSLNNHHSTKSITRTRYASQYQSNTTNTKHKLSTGITVHTLLSRGGAPGVYLQGRPMLVTARKSGSSGSLQKVVSHRGRHARKNEAKQGEGSAWGGYRAPIQWTRGKLGRWEGGKASVHDKRMMMMIRRKKTSRRLNRKQISVPSLSCLWWDQLCSH